MNYELAYRVGFHPWEDAQDQPAFVETLARLLDEEEAGREPPYGRALDVGTGSGIWGIELARRGWDVTGIDIVDRALERAAARVNEAGLEMRVERRDVTDLGAAPPIGDFRLVLDTGTFHGLGPAAREAAGRELTAITTPDATVLLLAWAPRRRGPFPRGADRAAIEAVFPHWEVTEIGPTGFVAPKPVELLLRPDERWYRLRRAAQGAAR